MQGRWQPFRAEGLLLPVITSLHTPLQSVSPPCCCRPRLRLPPRPPPLLVPRLVPAPVAAVVVVVALLVLVALLAPALAGVVVAVAAW